MAEKTWCIPVSWTMVGTVNVSAKTLEEAIDIVRPEENDIPLPEGDYLSGSWDIENLSIEEIRELYNDNEEDVLPSSSVSGRFTSVWDNGLEVTTNCVVDMDSFEVLSIDSAGCGISLITEDYTLEKEYVTVNGKEYPAFIEGLVPDNLKPGEYVTY